MIRRVLPCELSAAIGVLRGHRGTFPFLPRAAYERSLAADSLVAFFSGNVPQAVARFHDRMDGGRTLYEIAVAAALQRQRLGTRLMLFLQQDALSKGLHRICLKSEDGSALVSFYETAGFTRTGQSLTRAGKRLLHWESILDG